MNKKKKIFSLGLYVEGLRQLRMMGIVFAVIMGIEAIYIPLSGAITRMTMISAEAFPVESVNGMGAHPFLILTFIVIAPLMTLYLFGFMNKRNTSDFYHSLPHSRTSIYISFMAAILTWLLLIIVATSLLSIVTFLIFSQYFTLLYSSVMSLMLGCFVASFLVCAIISFAMTITGTVFTNVIISGILLFLPRLILNVIVSSVTGALPMVSGSINPFLSGSYNIVTDVVFKAIGISNSRGGIFSVFSSGYALIYTTVLALLYVILALVLFNKRHSESAAKSAPNRILQAVYRITITMVVCFFICAAIFGDLHSVYGYASPNNLFVYITAYLVAVAVYLLYELITTRKAKNLVKVLPGLGIVVILNIAIYASMYGLYTTELNFQPEPERINSMAIVPNSMPYSGSYLTYSEYASMISSQVEIKDKQLIEDVAKNFKENMVLFEQSPSEYMNEYTYQNHKGMSVNYIAQNIYMDSLDGNKTRTVYLSTENSEKLLSVLSSSQDYKKCWMDIPQPVDNTLRLRDASLPSNEISQLFDKYCEEVKNLSFEDWYEYQNSDYQPLFNFVYQIVSDSDTYTIDLPVFSSLTPDTCDLYFSYIYQNNANAEEVLTYLENISNNHLEAYCNAELYVYNQEAKRYDIYNFSWENDSVGQKKTAYILSQIMDEQIKTGKNYIRIYVEVVEERGGYSAIFSVKDDINVSTIVPEDELRTSFKS